MLSKRNAAPSPCSCVAIACSVQTFLCENSRTEYSTTKASVYMRDPVTSANPIISLHISEDET